MVTKHYLAQNAFSPIEHRKETSSNTIHFDFGNKVFIAARDALRSLYPCLSKESYFEDCSRMTNVAQTAVQNHFSDYRPDAQEELSCSLIRATEKAKFPEIDLKWANRAASLAKRLEDVLWQENIKSKLFFLDSHSQNYVAKLASLEKNKKVVRPEELETAMYLVLRNEQRKEDRYFEQRRRVKTTEE